MSSPAKRRRLSAHRQSIDGRKSIGVGAPRTALRTSTSGVNRNITSSSVNYDILTGEPIDPVKQRRPSQSQIAAPNSQQPPLRRSTSRQSMLPKPEQPVQVVSQSKHQDEILALQAQLHKLDYEKTNLKSEHEMLVLQHEKDLREAQARADAEHRKYQEAENERLKAIRQYETATKETREARDGGINEKAALDRRFRDLQTRFETLQEEKEDLETRLSDSDREIRRLQVEEVQGRRSTLERSLQETQSELDEIKSRFEVVNSKLNEKEKEAESLEAKLLELSGKTGGLEELEVLKRELNEQIAYVRRIENQSREQNAELRKLRDERRSVNVVLEEKRALEVQLQAAKEVEAKVGELEIQKEILEDEKRMWTSLLDNGAEDGLQDFGTPEAVVKTLVNERMEHALVLERLGREEIENAGKDEALRALESERNVLRMELAKANETAKPTEDLPDGKAIKRVERQRQLAQKEVDYLRAQIETFNAEETTMMENANFDAQRVEQVQNLQKLVDEYKSDIQTLHSQLTALETQSKADQLEPRGTKRAAEAPDPELENQNGQLQRKNKNLQTALQKSTLTSQQLAKELQATKSQLKALRNSAATRVLEMRDNPTAQHEAIKMSTLRTLKQENAELLVQLRGDAEAMSSVKVVPVSTVDALKLDLKDMESVVADKDKRMRRQREIWTEKAAEFRDVVASILGYKVYFMPNGKVKVSSLYYRDRREGGEQEEVPEEDREDYIMFDGEKGTMKTGGGRDGQFGQELEQLTDFWIRERNEIPCFLAAMTLEFYEKYGSLNGA